ncbi:DUF4411 family protein [Chromobacterium violaceum]|uniref:DUF4411 domain-containing protein n=1 Tax=Chromobacterium violaceum TaxID=536 RepID=A0A202BGX8_CHRVL|nr:DUF4411 family protein [Chromobacterium violaceum]OVE50621.1 hypothetical protein CBW21_01130 [Chromobacterium violaceum]
MKKYLLDSNIFIQAKNFHYNFGYCSAFWDWITAAHLADLVFSTQKVRTELLNGKADDPLVKWINQDLPESFFVDDLKDKNVMINYANIIRTANSNNQYTTQAKSEFAQHDKADAFLIATAKAHNYILVTQERSQPGARKRIMIPDMAQQCGVQTKQVWNVLEEISTGTFHLKMPSP